MSSILQFLHDLHSADGLRHLIQTGGLFVLVAIIFAETGLLAGFFLPGDSLLVTAGIFAAGDSQGGAPLFALPELISLLMLAAIVGDQLGYLIGRKTGALAFERKDSRLFKRKHLENAHAFFEKYGGRALILARFAPIFRTFVPFSAGIGKMPYRSFLKFSILGGVLWINSMVLLGYGLGHTELANQLHKVIMIVVFVSLLPMLVGILKSLKTKYSKNGSLS